MGILRRLRSSVRFQRDRGVSLRRALLIHLPERAFRTLPNLGYGRLFRTNLRASLRRQIEQVLQGVRGRPYFLIVVPDTLHTVLPCLALARRHVPVIIVENALRRWEQEALRDASSLVVHLPALPGYAIPHGVVLTLLLETVGRDFGLHDPDLFVFDSSIYNELETGPEEIAAGVYGILNKATGIRFPTTHLLAVNWVLAIQVCAKHGITPEIYRKTPSHLRSPLAAIGFGDHNVPKEYLRYYDPFNLLWCAALLEGARYRILRSPDASDVFHTGGISYDRYNVALQYVHARFLLLPRCRHLQERYWPRLVGKRLTIPTLARRLVQVRGEPTLAAIDRGIDRVAAAIGD